MVCTVEAYVCTVEAYVMYVPLRQISIAQLPISNFSKCQLEHPGYIRVFSCATFFRCIEVTGGGPLARAKKNFPNLVSDHFEL